MIRTLIADDSAIVRAMLGQVIGDDKRFEIVAMAENGKAAVELCLEHKPDLVIMDINMPVMSGLDAIKAIMEKMTTAIVVFTTEDTAEIGYICLDAGAVEVFQKPNLATMNKEKIEDFCKKLYTISDSYSRHDLKTGSLRKSYYAQSLTKEIIRKKAEIKLQEEELKFSILAIGASTGGPIAIQRLLKDLGPDFPLPIIITQHIDKIFETQFASWLKKTTGLSVLVASDGQPLKPGYVYIAPSSRHLKIKTGTSKNLITVLDDGKEVHFLKPAVDVMFSSCASVTAGRTLAVLLTGMGSDSAQGMKEVFDAGGCTIAQSEKSCVIYGMPKAAVALNCVRHIEDLDRIADLIKKITGVTYE